MKVTGITILAFWLASCATFNKSSADQSKTQQKLSESCIRQVPLAIGETDLTVLKLTSQICDEGSTPILWQQLSQRFFDLNHYAKAVEAANTTLKLQPDNAVAKDITFRAGLKITGRGLNQIKDSSLLYGDNLKDANLLVGQINRSVGEKPVEEAKPVSIKKSKPKYTKKVATQKRAVTKRAVVSQKTVVKPKPAAKPASKPAPSSAPRNPFSSFN